MRRWPLYLALTLLALPALSPLAAAGMLPRSFDHIPHFYRLVELDVLVRQGVWLPRWAPDMVHGYGYPVFNFFPYLAHYLAAALHWLGPDLLTAYKLAIALALLLAAWGAGALGTELWGSQVAGFLTGAAYLYSPYLLYDAHKRGALPETLALALLPWLLLAVRRAVLTANWRTVGVGAALTAAMILAHNGVSLQSLPFAGLLGLWELRQVADKRKSLVALTALFALGLGLAAFYLGPALAEAPFVQIARSESDTAMNYRVNFLALPEILRLPPLPVRPDLVNPPIVWMLPVAALGLGVLALWRWRRWGREARLLYGVLALGLGVTVFFMHPLAQPVWDNVRLLQLTLFPWRILGLASLFGALLAGALAQTAFRGRWVVGVGGITGVLALALPFYTVPVEAFPAAPTLADLARVEDTRQMQYVGTTSIGEYLPIWVQTLPDTGATQAQLLAGQPVNRIAPESLPDGVRLSSSHRTPLGETFNLQSAMPFTLTYQTFYFPGWHAMLNGQPVEIHISEPHGLMQVAVPAGAHELRFEFGDTPVRAVSNWVSVGAALLVLGLLFWPRKIGVSIRRRPALKRWANQTKAAEAASHALGQPASAGFVISARRFSVGRAETLPLRWALTFTFVPLALLALLRPLLVVPALQADGTLAAVQHTLNADFYGELVLLGWDADKTVMGADDTLILNLYWRATPNLHTPAGMRVRLVDAAGQAWSDGVTIRPRGWHYAPYVQQWQPDQYAVDPYALTPYAGTPPGAYGIEVAVLSFEDLRVLATQILPGVTIDRPSRRAAAVPLATLETVTLDAVMLDRDTLSPGETLIFARLWRQIANGPTPALRVALLDGTGAIVTETLETLPPLQVGDVLRRVTAMRLPAASPGGVYTWQIGEPGQPPLVTVPLTVTAPAHVFTAPVGLTELRADLGAVQLYGLEPLPTTIQPGATLPLNLFWQGQREMTVNYRVFVHLPDADGALITQADGVPALGQRPTTGWAPGEFITDPRPLNLPTDLPAGTYTLWVGLYDVRDGSRLTTPEFPEGRVALGQVVVP